jgi:hypothetical protein
MKFFIELIPPFIKSIIGVIAFLISLGWMAFISVNSVVKAEGKDIRKEVKQIRDIDMDHLNRRFDRIEELIKDHGSH